MIFGSVCSGIEAASVAWKPLGWRAAFVSEIEPFPRAVLQHRHPETPLHGDFTTIESGQYEPIDLLVGGTPCQSFSVAGLRGGLDDERGNLALEYLRLADRLRPRWLVWENVPGVLSSNGGRDFGAILGGMVELGYGFAYRVLDAQFFGLAQRRRRVFVVGYLGDWRRAAAVLLERHSLSGNPAPSREAGKRPAPTISARPTGGGGLGTDFDLDGGLIAQIELQNQGSGGNVGWADAADPAFTISTAGPPCAIAYSIMPQNSGKDYKARPVEVAQPVMAGGPTGGNQGGDYIVHAIQAGALRENPASGPDGIGVQADHAYTLEARSEVQAVAFALRGREGGAMPEMGGDHVGALRAASGGSSRDYVAFDTTQITSAANYSNPQPGDACHPLAAGAHPPAIAGSAVRRLTPAECEKLQGFSPGYTDIPWRGKDHAPDGPRYKALGNSMAVPVMAWIGRRIEAVEALTAERQAA